MHSPYRSFLRLVVLPALLVSGGMAIANAAPVIGSVRAGSGDRVDIRGQGFAAPCPACEVQAEYAGGLRIALQIDDWSDNAIVARLPDLNAGDQVRLRIVRGAQRSAPVQIRVKMRFEQSVLAHHKSQRKVGDKGELSVPIPAVTLQCAKSTRVFGGASIRYRKRRFAEAQIVSAPQPSCTTCKPVVIRWYHEPTGELDIEVIARWRIVEGVCATRKR
ncbi:MAG: hypothetical protein R3E68_10360 [Burkholderiaceae bacterium]